MHAPLITVIIPTYNRSQSITRTIESVLNQEYSNFEIIVVDDGGTDNTKELVESISSTKVNYYYKQNGERGAARNYGLDRAKGEYVTFLDSDDIFYPNHLSDAVDFAKANPLQNNFFFCDFRFVSEKLTPLKIYQRKLTGDYIRDIATGNFLACIGVFLSKEVYDNFRFSEYRELSGTEDWELWLRITAIYPNIGHIDKVNCAMIQHSDRSVNNEDIKNLIFRREHIIDMVRQDPKLFEAYKSNFNLLKGSSYLYIAANAAGQGSKIQGLKYLIKSLVTYPKLIFSIRVFVVVKNLILN